MIEKIEDIVGKQVEAIKNIKFDKITVWDGGSGSSNGSTTANFMRDLIKSLPAMHDLAEQAGIALPSILGKVDNFDNVEKEEKNKKEETIVGKFEEKDGTIVAICPHCATKYKTIKNEKGEIKIAGFNDIDGNLEGQQIYCIKCGTKFTTPQN